jgi:hypothetical protein
VSICVYFPLAYGPLRNIDTPHNTTEHTHAMILTSALERQVPCDDTDDEVVDINEVAYPK